MITQQRDYDADALYIELAEDAAAARTVEIDPGTLVDLDDNDRVIGIEVIHPARPWPLDEILARFDIPAREAGELRAYFPSAPRRAIPATDVGDIQFAFAS